MADIFSLNPKRASFVKAYEVLVRYCEDKGISTESYGFSVEFHHFLAFKKMI
jgi:hypothetical protein